MLVVLMDKKTMRARINKQHIKRYTRKTDYKSKFSKIHYDSGDGMLTTVWGPPKWHYLHTMSFNYPVNPTDDDKTHYKTYIESLQHTLPCKYCRQNFQQNLKILPVTREVLKNRENFSRYIYNLHNLVNTMLKKKIYISYEEVRDRYENFRARCSKDEIKQKTFTLKKEKGCTQPLYGEKSKCIIKIVPQSDTSETFIMDKKCERTND
jgi:hypothetical protein